MSAAAALAILAMLAACAATTACGGGGRAPAPAADSPRTATTGAPAAPIGDSSAPAPPPVPTAPFSYSRRVGVLQDSRDAGPCLVVADSSLRAGTPVLLVFPDRPQRLGSGQVRAKRDRPCTEPGDEWGAVMGGEAGDAPEYAAYDVVLAPHGGDMRTDAPSARSGLGIAITWGAGLVTLRGDSAAGDLDSDGRAESFGACTSHEGIHLSVTGDSAGAAVRRWHRYYYVPYDLEPTCSETRASDSPRSR